MSYYTARLGLELKVGLVTDWYRPLDAHVDKIPKEKFTKEYVALTHLSRAEAGSSAPNMRALIIENYTAGTLGTPATGYCATVNYSLTDENGVCSSTEVAYFEPTELFNLAQKAQNTINPPLIIL